MTNAKIKTFATTRSNLIRIALVLKHGGVYMDSTFILLDGLEWIVNIDQYPSEYIFNRYGSLPRVLLTFHPWYANPSDWQIDEVANTKSAWHLAY